MDEHVPRAVTEALRRRDVDALTAQDVRMIEADDQLHLERAGRDRRVVFTQDADFLRLHAAGVQHAGIVYAPQQTTIRHMVQRLLLIVEVLTPEDLIGHVEFL